VFGSLKFRHRVWLLVGVATTALIAATAVTLVLGTRSERQVAQVETLYVPLVELDRDLKTELAAIQRTYENAADAGEESGLRDADALRDRFLQRLVAAGDTIAGNGGTPGVLEDEFRNYYAIARAVSAELVAGHPPAEMKVEQLRRARASFEADLEVATTPDHSRLTAAFEAARASQHTAFVLDGAVALGALVAMTLLSWQIIRRTVRTLHEVSMGMERLARGEFGQPIAVSSRDELGSLAHEANQAAIRLREYRELDDREAWVKTGLAELATEIAGELHPITLGRKAMVHLAECVGADVAVAYVGDNDGQFHVLDSYGVADTAAIPASFRTGETILGQVARDDTIRVLADVADNYLAVRSALGAMKPRYVVVVPLAHEARTMGILELALLHEPSERAIDLLSRARSMLGSALQVAESRQRADALLAETQRQAEELARTSRYKSEFLANMSHELRTPLNSIMILSKILADNDGHRLDDKQIEFAGLIHKSGEELLALINDVLDLAKVEAGKQSLVCAPMEISTIVDYVRRMFEPLAIQKQLGFDVSAATDLPAEIRTDWKRLSQIVKNLVANAFKFTERGRVTVRIDKAEPVGGRATIAIAVTDTGIGIAPDKHARIFEAFAQIEGGTSRKYGGTGLGLTIARDLASNLGGDLVVDSELGRGSTFRVILPIDGPRSEAPGGLEPVAVQTPSLAMISDDREGLVDGDSCMLVIEDDVAFAAVVSHLVREASLKVIVAQRGRIGLDLARRYRPSGIILDVGLPDLDGWTVMETLRSDPTTREIPVHFITASNDADRAMRLGAVGFTTKPVDAAQVRSALHALDRAARVGVRRVLLVETEDSLRASLRSLLAGGALEVEAVATPKEALARLAMGAYGCVVMNLALPDKTQGFELLANVRGEPTMAAIPIVVHTSDQLDAGEIRRLESDEHVIIVLEGERTKERVLEETRMFVHRVRADSSPRAPSLNEAVLAALDGKTVLLVDDDMRNVYSLSSALRAKNLTVLTAADGQEALDELDRHPDTDVVLMDVMMPRMDGHEATRRIRVQDRFRDLPIIALTAKTMPGEREKCIDAGANDYVPKPVDVSRLLALLRVWLS